MATYAGSDKRLKYLFENGGGGGGGSNVTPNPQEPATDNLEALKIDSTVYAVTGRGLIPNFNNRFYNQAYTASSTNFQYSYTATQDCFVSYAITCRSGAEASATIIDGTTQVQIEGIYAGTLVQKSGLCFLKKGQTIRCVTTYQGASVWIRAYSVIDLGLNPITLSDCYSTEERQVGCWINGKPIYQRTVTAVSNVNINNYSWTDISNAIDNPISNLETLIGAKLHNSVPNDSQTLRFYSDSGVLKCASYTSAGTFYTGLVLSLLYTKTTDVAGAGIWTPSGAEAVHYSTDEQIIGTWLGRTLYSRVFDLGSEIQIQQSTWYISNIDTLVPNISNIINAFGISGGTTYPLVGGVNGQGKVQFLGLRETYGAFVRYISIDYLKSV